MGEEKKPIAANPKSVNKKKLNTQETKRVRMNL